MRFTASKFISVFFYCALSTLLLFSVGCGADTDTDTNSKSNNSNIAENNSTDVNNNSSDDPDLNNHHQSEEIIEVSGSWSTPWDTVEDISNDWWDFMEIVFFENSERFAITRNPDDAEFGAGTFNKLVWTEPHNDSFYYCTVGFGYDTADDALNTENTADASDPDTDGCGGFAWTKMTRD